MIREIEHEEFEHLVEIIQRLERAADKSAIAYLLSERSYAVGYAKGLEEGSKWLKDLIKRDER